jgi:flagellar biosynthesis protein FliP
VPDDLPHIGRHATLAATAIFTATLLFIATASPALAQSSSASPPAAPLLADPVVDALRGGPESWTSPERLSSTLQVMLLLTVLSLAPAILMMTTSFVRIVVVLGLLRQAIGAQQLPPSQVITTLALFATLLVMGPTWTETIQPEHSALLARRNHRSRDRLEHWRGADQAVHEPAD